MVGQLMRLLVVADDDDDDDWDDDICNLDLENDREKAQTAADLCRLCEMGNADVKASEERSKSCIRSTTRRTLVISMVDYENRSAG
jgi:hypothetical protein